MMSEEIPRLKLSEEEEKILANLDRNVHGCPRVSHSEEYHVSHMLKTLFLGIPYVGLSKEEERLIEKIDDWLDEVWLSLNPPDDNMWLELEDHGYDEMVMKVNDPDGLVKHVKLRFKKVNGEWTLAVEG